MIADFDKKGNSEFFNNKVLFKTAGIIIVLVVLILIFADIKIYQKKQELNSQIRAYQKQIENIQKSSQNLKNEIANADSKDYLEKLGYEQFNQAKPGETEYIFVTPQTKAKTAVSSKNFWDAWLGWVSGSFQWIKSKL